MKKFMIFCVPKRTTYVLKFLLQRLASHCSLRCLRRPNLSVLESCRLGNCHLGSHSWEKYFGNFFGIIPNTVLTIKKILLICKLQLNHLLDSNILKPIQTCMPISLAPDPIRVQSCVWCIFWTNRNCMVVTSIFFLSHHPKRDDF